MRILQVLLSPRIGGAETLTDSLTTEWTRNGTICMTHYLDAATSATRSRSERLKRLQKTISDWQPDILVSHSALPNVYSRLAAPLNLPVVTVLHSANDDFVSGPLRWAEYLLRLRTTAVVAVSQQQAQQYLAHFGTRVPMRVIPNGIRDDARPKKRYADVPANAITVARVASQKNPKLWLETAKLLAETGSTLKLGWWGPQEVDDGLADVFTQRSLTETVGAYHGATEDPIGVLSSGDLLFHPADREAHSIGILEAAAVGLPIVCSDTVAMGLPKTVEAVSFESGVPESAAKALKMVCDNWRFYAERALLAAPAVGMDFSIDKCSSQYIGLFGEILDSNSRTSRSRRRKTLAR